MSNALECAGVTKGFGTVRALDGVDLTVAAGHLTALLGPSGCGKSTLLRVIAGFERPDDGSIRVRSELVAGPGADVPPERRRTGIVPQEQALFPHLSVAANVGFGLTREGRRVGRVEEMLELCGLSGLGPRMPHELSGGQQQRVAIARALAPSPAVILLDEPFANLDATLRSELRADIAAILRDAGQTALLVTHDQDEALSVADTVAVMRSGRIVQHASPSDLYRRPTDAWLAAFVGSANVLSGTQIAPGRVRCALGELSATGPSAASGGAVDVVVRPEQVHLVEPDAGTAAGTVRRREYHGHDALVWVALGDGTEVVVRTGGGDLPASGSRVGLSCDAEVVAFDRPGPDVTAT